MQSNVSTGIMRGIRQCVPFVALLVMWLPGIAGITDPCMSVKIPLAERIAASRHIIHGQVVAQRATWDDAQRSIYTINTVVVHDVWKTPDAIGDTILVLTEGGDMGTMGRTVVGTLKLDLGDEGYLMLEHPRAGDVSFRLAGVKTFHRPYAELQALLVADSRGVVRDCWGSTLLSVNELQQRHFGRLSHAMRAPRGASTERRRGVEKEPNVLQSTISFAPQRVIGGMGQTVTIIGSGFGNERGTSYVTFTSDGTNYHGAEYAGTFVYRKWTDAEIVVEAPPSYSGRVRVVVGGTAKESADTLRFTSNLSARSLSPPSYTNLINTNGKGGYTWSLDKALFDIPQARECVASVMRQFRCKTGMAFDLATEATTVGYALNDGVNAIVFDAPGYELGAGAVAYCDWIWYSCIVGSETFYYVRDTDCRLSRKFDWYYGDGKNPSFGMAKLRYVLYHEIGHAHQFGHVNEWGESMHPVVQALPAEEWLERDTITASEKEAGTYMTMQGRNFTFRGCGIQPLVAPANTDCNSDVTSDVQDEVFESSLGLRVFPQPASDVITFELSKIRTQVIDVVMYDMLGTRVFSGVLPPGEGPVRLALPTLAHGRYAFVASSGNHVYAVGDISIGK